MEAHLRNVSLKIELKDRKLDINVMPTEATIILHFQDKSKYILDVIIRRNHTVRLSLINIEL